MEFQKKLLRPVATQIRSIDEAARTIEFVASTETVDRYGDVIRVAGWKLDNYMKNPVFLWAHRSGDPPIGKTVGIAIEMNPPALVQKVQFASREVYPFADTIYRLYKGGFLNATSVGFMPDPDKTKQREDADGNALDGLEFNGQELLELSAVPVPANPEALGRMVQKGLISETEKRGICGEDNPPWSYMAPGVTYPEDTQAVAAAAGITAAVEVEESETAEGAQMDLVAEMEADKQIVEVDPRKVTTRQRLEMFCDEGRRLVEDAQAQLKAIRLTVDQSRLMTREGLWQISEELAALGNRIAEIEKRSAAVVTVDAAAVRAVVLDVIDEQRMVCPYHEEPLADPGMAWDAAAEMSDASTPEEWKRMNTVMVGDPDLKGSYKLPHHRGPSGKFETVKAGVSAALARLDQTDMPAEDRAGAKAHLDKHMAEFAKAVGPEEIRTGDGGAPEKPASETLEPETKSNATEVLDTVEKVEALLQKLLIPAA